jgi:tyrosine-protein phosphatase YwqE
MFLFSFFSSSKPLGSALWRGFADVHSHIIPGVDDGPQTMEESLEMIRVAYAGGVRRLVATPHIREGWRTDAGILREKLHTVEQQVRQEGMLNLELSLAAEYMLDEVLMQQLPERNLLALPGNRLLVETSFYGPPMGVSEMFFKIQMHGYVPVLAHPERYDYYRTEAGAYRAFKEQGCLFQLDLLSLQGAHGAKTRQTALQLLTQGMIDLVGSDMHHPEHARMLRKYLDSPGSAPLWPLVRSKN